MLYPRDPHYLSSLLRPVAGSPGVRWAMANGSAVVRYDLAPTDLRGLPGEGVDYARPHPLSGAEQQAFRRAFQEYEHVAGLDFRAAAGTAAGLRVVAAEAFGNVAGITYTSWDRFGHLRDATVVLDDAALTRLEPGSFGYLTMIHELGHAVGLKHPFEPPDRLGTGQDHRGFTVMSYRDHPGTGVDASLGGEIEPRSPMLYDIAALQALYGANHRFADGDTRYRLADGIAQLRTIWDGGGVDRIDASGQRLAVEIDLRPGAFSSIGRAGDGPLHEVPAKDNLAIALGTRIEDATGGRGDDLLIGNAFDNRLRGGAGDDRLVGGEGRDLLIGGRGDDLLEGGAGDDRLYGRAGLDEFRFAGRFGHDEIRDAQSGERLTLPDLLVSDLRFERSGNHLLIRHQEDSVLIRDYYRKGLDLLLNDQPLGPHLSGRGAHGLVWQGGPHGDRKVGTAFDDRLSGGSGNDRLWGKAGDDVLTGGPGADRLYGGDGSDRLVGGPGKDFESGKRGDDVLIGGPGDDRLFGRRGDDVLDPGSGDDRVDGGRGTDTVLLGGLFEDYALSRSGKGWTLRDLDAGDGDDGRDRLHGVEILHFADVEVSLSGGRAVVLGPADATLHAADHLLHGDTAFG